MTKKQLELIKKIRGGNDTLYNLHKAAEEFMELALVLTQFALKPEKVNHQEVYDEIGDVKIRLAMIEDLFYNSKDINKRVKFKLDKFEEYLKTGKYEGRI